MLSQNPTASLSGAVRWLIVPSGGDPKPESELQSVLAFDIVNEKMRVYKTPIQSTVATPGNFVRVFLNKHKLHNLIKRKFYILITTTIKKYTNT